MFVVRRFVILMYVWFVLHVCLCLAQVVCVVVVCCSLLRFVRDWIVLFVIGLFDLV